MIKVSEDEYMAFISRYRSKVGEVYSRSHIAADCVNVYDKATDMVIAQAYAPMPEPSYYISEIGSADVTE